MKISDLLSRTSHRPWLLPDRRWRYYQEWNRAIFLHWQVDELVLRKFVPDELGIDLFEGKAWISLVAFTMERIRPRFLPSFPPVSNFDEINIRTYVKKEDKQGVYFLNIEGGKRISCWLAKKISALPYQFAKMKRSPNRFISAHASHQDELAIHFKLGEELEEKAPVDLWLSERYALFQDNNKMINKYEIHHIAWPMQDIKIDSLHIKYPRFKELIHSKPDRIHYSTGVQVLAWPKEVIDYP